MLLLSDLCMKNSVISLRLLQYVRTPGKGLFIFRLFEKKGDLEVDYLLIIHGGYGDIDKIILVGR